MCAFFRLKHLTDRTCKDNYSLESRTLKTRGIFWSCTLVELKAALYSARNTINYFVKVALG